MVGFTGGFKPVLPELGLFEGAPPRLSGLTLGIFENDPMLLFGFLLVDLVLDCLCFDGLDHKALLLQPARSR